MLELTIPKFDELRSVYGSPRLVWLRTLVNVPSALTCNRSVIVNDLLRPVERFTSPGPSTEPLGALPKRPIGSGWGPEPLPVRHGFPTAQVLSPGQPKAEELIQLRRPLPVGFVLTPVTLSAYGLRWPGSQPAAVVVSPEPVPEGSSCPGEK